MSANSADGPATVEVVLVKAGRTKISYPAELLADDGTRVSVRAPWAGEGVRDFGFVRFEPGDVFTEHYWRDRWYSVKEVRASGARSRATTATSPARPSCPGAAWSWRTSTWTCGSPPTARTYDGWTRTSSRRAGCQAGTPTRRRRGGRPRRAGRPGRGAGLGTLLD